MIQDFYLTTDFTDFTDSCQRILGSQAPDLYGWTVATGRHLYQWALVPFNSISGHLFHLCNL